MKRVDVRDLDLYMRCPRAYKLKMLDGVIPSQKHLSLCKSIVVKRVIFWMYEQCKLLNPLSSESIEKQCEEFWKQELNDDRIDKQELLEIVVAAKAETKKSKAKPAVTKQEKILGDIKSWCLKFKEHEDFTDILYCDIPYECQIGDIIFTSKIDLVRKTDNGIEIIKLRTSSNPPTLAFIERDTSFTLASYATWKGSFFRKENDSDIHFSIAQIPQASYYYLPYLDTYKRNSKKGKKGDSKGNPVISRCISKNKLIDFEYELLQITAGIDMNYFPMRVVQPCGCCICSFRYQCSSFAETENYNQVLH